MRASADACTRGATPAQRVALFRPASRRGGGSCCSLGASGGPRGAAALRGAGAGTPGATALDAARLRLRGAAGRQRQLTGGADRRGPHAQRIRLAVGLARGRPGSKLHLHCRSGGCGCRLRAWRAPTTGACKCAVCACCALALTHHYRLERALLLMRRRLGSSASATAMAGALELRHRATARTIAMLEAFTAFLRGRAAAGLSQKPFKAHKITQELSNPARLRCSGWNRVWLRLAGTATRQQKPEPHARCTHRLAGGRARVRGCRAACVSAATGARSLAALCANFSLRRGAARPGHARSGPGRAAPSRVRAQRCARCAHTFLRGITAAVGWRLQARSHAMPLRLLTQARADVLAAADVTPANRRSPALDALAGCNVRDFCHILGVQRVRW